ncbi:MAG TPA: penicillin-binding protein 2, partial [Clostridiaceae bacterium]|nr:penicillin-binding protein 2 [Clostridiaceae bacterium]
IIRILTVISVLATIAILLNLFKIQVNDSETYVLAGANQQFIMQESPSKRGNIYDSNGVLLASSAIKYTIGVTPKDVRSLSRKVSEEEIAAYAANALSLPLSEVTAALEQKGKSYIQLVKAAPEESAEGLRSWLSENRVGGFAFDLETERLYTNGDLAGQLIGFTRFEDNKLSGVLGLEAYYNSKLNGEPGYSYARRDNYSNHGTVPFSIPTDQKAVDGSDMHLFLNIEMQEALQQELEQIAGVAGLSSGVCGLVMDVNTGGILAMGQIPTMKSQNPFAMPGGIDPQYWNHDLDEITDQLSLQVWRNANISNLFEPGSTMKAITTAIAFEEGVASEHTQFSDDPIEVMTHEISCVYKPGHGVETVEEALINSCNPVFVQIGQLIDMDLFYDYISTFGFRDKTGIDLPAEGNTIFHKQPSILDYANLTFGESLAVTPLHMARAYAALVNGGYLVTPAVVKEFVNSDGTIEPLISEEPVQVISQQTSERMKQLLRGAANEGHSWDFACEGFSIVGKTSTSTDETDGQSTYSFIAVGPEEISDVLCMIVVEKPITKFSGSAIVANHTKRLLGKVMDIRGYKRSYDEDSAVRLGENITLPSITGLTFSEAAYALSEMNIFARRANPEMHYDEPVSYLKLSANDEVAVGSTVWLTNQPEQEMVHVPDFSGLEYHNCIWLAEESGIVIRVNGTPSPSGVLAQDPLPTISEISSEEYDEVGAPGVTDGGENSKAKVARGSIIDIWFEDADPEE